MGRGVFERSETAAAQVPATGKKISFNGRFVRDPLNERIVETLISNYDGGENNSSIHHHSSVGSAGSYMAREHYSSFVNSAAPE